MAPKPPRDQTRTTSDWLIDRAAGFAIGLGRVMPNALQGALARGVSLPLGKVVARAEENLALIWPDMDPRERRKIAQGSVRTMIRGTIENADGDRLLRHASRWTPKGDGVAAMDEAEANGRTVILISGHFGNWEAGRAAFTRRGHKIGALYRPLNNGYLDDRWAALLGGLSGPVFPRGREGFRDFLRYLKSGGWGGILPDQFVADGAILDFMGLPAPTSLAPAELALRYDAPLIPFYGIRQSDGRNFDVRVEAPIPPGKPEDMMQAFNDSLGARIRENPDQWLWPHRRWKPERVRRMTETAVS